MTAALPITAPFNNVRTPKFKAQPTNEFFATLNQMFGGFSQLLTTAERAVIKSLSTVQTTKQFRNMFRKLQNLTLKLLFLSNFKRRLYKMLIKDSVSH